MESDTSKKLNETKFKDFQEYLYDHACFGFTATRRKKVIIYSFRRFYTKLELLLKVKVDRKTKNVISVMNNGNIYTTFDGIKKLVEK